MLKETFKGFLIEKKLKKNIFLVSKNDIKYIVKIKYNPRIEKKYLSIFIDKLGLTNIHFNKELSILKYLTNQEFLYFKYPKLFETDNKTYFIIDFIDGKKEWNINEINRTNLIKALIEFQIKGNKLKFEHRYRIIAPLFSPIGFIIRELLTIVIKYCGVVTSLKTFLLVVRLNFRNSKQNYHFLLHRDLMQNPVILSDNYKSAKNIISIGQDIFFLDFGSVIKTQKFILKDIVDIAFNIRQKRMDWTLVDEYLEEAFNKKLMTSINVLDQVRIALLQNIFAEMNMKRARTDCINFLKNILLSDSEFEKWCSNKI